MFNKLVIKSVRYSVPKIGSVCKQQLNKYHISTRNENTMIVGGAALLTGAAIAQYALSMYNSMPAKSDQSSSEPSETNSEAKPNSDAGSSSAGEVKADTEKSMFSSWFAKNYYEGGFEDKMTKREAALILGVRESTTGDRIKDAHRRILLLNHPDRGGSAYVAAKINEAKDLLIKGK